ncbi:MAG TPA: cupin domain-containing protein [Gaiellaceae bacterium]|nr:cupin domain-containing protein [Gaiellaceae bacterium]
MGIAHWDEVEGERAEEGHLDGTWFDLGDAAGSRDVGVCRIKIAPRRWSTPAHVELDEEEIFYVLGGSGLSWQDGKTHEVRPRDCIVHRVGREAHTLWAGDDGLDVLAFGERTNPGATLLPRAKVLRMGPTVDVSGGPHPWEREAAAGPPELPSPDERPTNVLNLEDAELTGEDGGGRWIRLAFQAGSERSGLNWAQVNEGHGGAPPHCHSEEEEIFVILEGRGTLELWPSPVRAETHEHETIDVGAGHVVSRPAGTGIAHYFRGGEGGMTFLAYGTKRPNDICYYPRSNKIYWRGVGVIARLDSLDYDDGEPED